MMFIVFIINVIYSNETALVQETLVSAVATDGLVL